MRQRVRGGENHRRNQPRPALSGRPNAQAGWLRSAGTDRALAGAGGHLRHGIRPVCDARLRRPRRGLPAEAFQRTTFRARARLGERRTLPEIAPEARPAGVHPQRMVVKDGTRVHVIPIARLDYVAAQDDYVALHSEGKSYLKQQPIAAVEALLDPACFVRIHRSAIVNLERVARIAYR